MDFEKMTLTETVIELNRYRKQLNNQSTPITKAQMNRWDALARAYRQKSEDLAK